MYSITPHIDGGDAELRPARIKVIGVGGGGGNAVKRMMEEDLRGVEFVSVNTDHQALQRSPVTYKIQIGKKLTKGLGAGARPEVGRAAFEEDRDEVAHALSGADLVFVTAGLGGGTGTGASPGIACLARETGALTIAVVSRPFLFEGRKRNRIAEAGAEELLQVADSLIVVPNERLLSVVATGTPLLQAFKKADEVLLHATRGIADLVQTNGEINVDFADVRTVMARRGRAVMGEGVAEGEGRARRAAMEAIASPLLDEVSLTGAAGILVNITGGSGMSLEEVGEAVEVIHEASGEDAEIIFGAVHDPRMRDSIRVTVVAAGLPWSGQQTREAGPPSQAPKPRSAVPPDRDNLDVPAFLRRRIG
jgi:cell division protein FtsZ